MYTDNSIASPSHRASEEILERMLGPSTSMPDRNTGSLRLPEGFPLASVYAPTQIFRDLYGREEALAHGTLFRELDFPFLGQTVTKGGGCRG